MDGPVAAAPTVDVAWNVAPVVVNLAPTLTVPVVVVLATSYFTPLSMMLNLPVAPVKVPELVKVTETTLWSLTVHGNAAAVDTETVGVALTVLVVPTVAVGVPVTSTELVAAQFVPV